jgi:hypothetical protein
MGEGIPEIGMDDGPVAAARQRLLIIAALPLAAQTSARSGKPFAVSLRTSRA